MKKNLVVLDYDETFTTNKELWSTIVTLLMDAGFHVICCTLRFGYSHYDDDVLSDMARINIEVVFAGLKPDKKTAIKDAGYTRKDWNIIWIDDYPEFINLKPLEEDEDHE